jgi:hypothetical protein
MGQPAPNVTKPRGIAAVLDEVTRLHAAGDFARAEALILAELPANSGSGALHNARGVMLASMEQWEEAIRCYRASLRLSPGEPGVWTNLGNALTRLRLFEAAVHCHREAIARAPGDGGLRYNLGISFAESGRHGDAVAAFTQALHLAPDHDMACWDRGRSYLHLGNLAHGWADFEIRLRNGLVPPRPCPGVRWDGRPFAGRRLVLLSEQGFGDMIWAHRYLARVKALGGEVVLECQPELAGLFRSAGIADLVVPQGAALPEADLHAWYCSLPGLFTPDLAAIPGGPYIVPPPARAAVRRHFAAAGGRLRVGIVWSGSTTFVRNAERAQTLARFLTAFAMPGVQLFSLQKGPPQGELAGVPTHEVVDLAADLGGFDDTAAAVAALDLVIMTDSAVGHLAGTMGRPVWVLLGRNAHWLWMQDRSDSPWYPSMRLFRPRAGADWDHVFDRAAASLMEMLRHRKLI